MRKSGFLIYYVLFCIVCFSLGLLLSFILKSETFATIPPKLELQFTLTVLQANSTNFLLYLFCFPISPLLQLFDLLSLGIQLGISGQMIGIVATIKGILPHGLIEIPNFIWYQGIVHLWRHNSLNHYQKSLAQLKVVEGCSFLNHSLLQLCKFPYQSRVIYFSVYIYHNF